MKTKYTTFYFNDIDIEVETTYEFRTDYPDHPDGFWQEVKREIVYISHDLDDKSPSIERMNFIKKFIDKAKIDL